LSERGFAGSAMQAAWSAVGAVAAAVTAFRATTASGEAADILRERRGLWDGHSQDGRPWVWIHAASVGEADIAVAVARALREERPALRYVVSTMTATGRARAAREPGIESRFFPLDFAPFLKRVLDPRPPLLFVAVETELWPETLRLLQESGTATTVVNARLSGRSLPRYRMLMPLLEPLAGRLASVCARDEEAALRWLSIGAREAATAVTGNIKFDLAVPRDDGEDAPLFEADPDHPILLAASTHEGEDEIALEAFAAVRERHPGARLLLAPRHPRRSAAVHELARGLWLAVVHWSDIVGISAASQSARRSVAWPPRVEAIVLDRLGLLRAAYASSAAAFVGGSAARGPGGHNLLEPVMAGCPAAAGPHLDNVEDQRAVLDEAGALRIVANPKELSRFWLEAIESPQQMLLLLKDARIRTERRSGALGRSVRRLLAAMPPPAAT
jgi:3-deoxy-D-manno-octulosonic-acid transferase